ncbi:hypothetical protein V6U78_04025 [Marinospirillum sp. MEB164]|uniref:Uncharacterized protein n=1 Tax=Marinospirillum alkalitolerans TaxID=3123374 RepID=A0ABW8PV89_9GAMM
MPLWLFTLLCFLHLQFTGMIAMGLIFMACAEGNYIHERKHNDRLVRLWFLYSFSIPFSLGWLIYGYATDQSPRFYWWFALPWALLLLMLSYWRITGVSPRQASSQTEQETDHPD